jgi:toxin ParE1/3/4
MSARKRRLVLSPRASDDLDDILLYTEQQWGNEQREQYQQGLLDGLNQLLTFPFLGKERPDYEPGARSIQIEHHVAIYRVSETEVLISRIVHVRRDIAAELFE